MNKIFQSIRNLLSSVKPSAQLSLSMLLLLITLIDSLKNIGFKWRPIQELSISTYIGFWSFVIFYRKELDLVAFRVDGDSAIKLGIVLMFLSILLSVFIVLPYIL